jgi:GTP-sensing pleiotropic transcriptional regulator CodY
MGDSDRDRDEDSGRYVDKYPPEEILEAIDDLSGTAATSEVADAIGCSRDTAYKKLQLMEERGQVTSRRAGGIRVWSVVDE